MDIQEQILAGEAATQFGFLADICLTRTGIVLWESARVSVRRA
ncbi:MAG TPA: hypothetical protein VGI66_01515 [Streptosporangiaceae bacterium]